MPDNSTPERRSSPRRAANWRVLFGAPGDNLAPGFLADMSPIGVSILTDVQYPAGTEVEVHFGVEVNESVGKLQMRAVVRYCKNGRMGVQFVNVNPSQREHWWKIMRGEL